MTPRMAYGCYRFNFLSHSPTISLPFITSSNMCVFFVCFSVKRFVSSDFMICFCFVFLHLISVKFCEIVRLYVNIDQNQSRQLIVQSQLF